MPKQIQAYFKTEDEAEGARTSLQAYRTEHLEVGQLEGTLGRDRRLLIPFVTYNTGGSINTGGATGAVATGTGYGNHIAPVVSDREDEGVRKSDSANTPGMLDAADVFSSEDNANLQYVLSAKVEDADVEEIVHKLRANHAYVERFDD
ncbi:hypothetical protein OIN60_00175 [Paenibacillus sp. P96]|uniref:General stress protein 17M-like domain-containing protein n=1 Tax=Paenibacillus zeirhizosphaerae TaxID=2987519 RepID=A0ABT9FKE9_9BACL|nr:hypothetical protein [Paenibacillus sp. P96]MDP4095206.1 hypothetical protein [Paenibacillus sp. P96]